MIEQLLNSYRFNLDFAHKLVEDLDEKLMTESGGIGLENHPAWTLGHLISGANLTLKYLGEEPSISTKWDELFRRNGPGDPRKPNPDRSVYPTKKELLEELNKQHLLVEKKISGLAQMDLNKPHQWKFSSYFPTLFDMIHFMCVTHETMHLSQLSSWRRAMGLNSALAKM